MGTRAKVAVTPWMLGSHSLGLGLVMTWNMEVERARGIDRLLDAACLAAFYQIHRLQPQQQEPPMIIAKGSEVLAIQLVQAIPYTALNPQNVRQHL
jgi:hypothetical protein